MTTSAPDAGSSAAPDAALHPRIRELLDLLDASRAELREAVDEVPAVLRERRPAPDRWCVAEVLEHLGLVQRRIAQVLAARFAAARAEGLGPERETSSVRERVPNALLQDRTQKVVAPEPLQPTGTLGAARAWDALEEARAALNATVRSADGLALGELTHQHPRLGVLDLYQYIGSVGGHESRHAAQVREIADAFIAADGG
jgi:hypothetical protein